MCGRREGDAETGARSDKESMHAGLLACVGDAPTRRGEAREFEWLPDDNSSECLPANPRKTASRRLTCLHAAWNHCHSHAAREGRGTERACCAIINPFMAPYIRTGVGT